MNEVCEAEKADLDSAINSLANEIQKTGGITSALRNILSSRLEQGETISGKESPPANDIVSVIWDLAEKLAYQNDRLEKLLVQLEARIGQVKII